MRVFISWSGDLSHKVAYAFNEWLPCVLQGVQPFMSSEGIHKGAPWFEAIGEQLEETDFGILCLTPFNLEAPWILFEAGALSKKVGKARVVPFVLGLSPSELKPPLSNFNAATVTKEDTLKLVRSVNDGLKDKQLSDNQLARVFEKWWPELEAKLRQAEDALQTVRAGRAASEPAARSAEDMLGELLELTRSIAQRDVGGGVPPYAGAGLPDYDGGDGGDLTRNTLADLLARGLLHDPAVHPQTLRRLSRTRGAAGGLLGELSKIPTEGTAPDEKK